MDHGLPFGYTHTQKRSHAQMDLDGSSSPPWSGIDLRHHHHLAASREPSAGAPHSNHAGFHHLPRPNNMPHPHPHPPLPSPPPRRYAGDGFDYRRPAASSTVIDLTTDDADANGWNPASRRPPRFGRDIMQNPPQSDVIDLVGEDAGRASPGPVSPDFQIISSRRITPSSRTGQPTFGRYTAEEEDVEFVRANPLPEAQRRPDAIMDAHREFNRRFGRHFSRILAHVPREPTMPPRGPRGGRVQRVQGFRPPNLAYEAAAFDMGFGPADPGEELAPAPTYEAPSKAPHGFTRSPQEDGALVCPNCGDELCVGESDLKRQVWIVKQCGHVYCGECTANRAIKKSAKGKERQSAPRTKSFKECVVDGCQKKVANKAQMFQVFL